jgi:hypothetical protein
MVGRNDQSEGDQQLPRSPALLRFVGRYGVHVAFCLAVAALFVMLYKLVA